LNELGVVIFQPYPDWTETTTYQTLVSMNATAQQEQNVIQFLPDLAINWTVSPNGQTYTFNLRPGVTFSNGDPFNAYQAWADFYIFYFASGNFSSFWMGAPIFNMTGVTFGQVQMNILNQSGLASPSSAAMALMSNTSLPAYVTGPDTIVYQLSAPYSFFLNTLLGWTGFQLDSQYILANGGPGTAPNFNSAFNYQGQIPGTGPYILSDIVPNSFAVFTQNPTYWGSNMSATGVVGNPFVSPGHYSKVIIYDKPSESTRLLDLNSGAAQIVSLTSSDLLTAISEPNTYGVMTLKYPAGVEYLQFNTQVFPTNITDVRLAMVHAINYSAVIQVGADGLGVRYMGPESPNYGQYYDPGNFPLYQQNITLAEQELAAAGFPNGKGFPTLNFIIVSASTYWEIPAAQEIQADLSQIGINTNIVVQPLSVEAAPYGSYSTNLADAAQIEPLQLSWTAYSPDYLAPTDYWTAFVTTFSSFGNFDIYNNSIVDQAVQLMYSSNNQTAILQALTNAQQQIYNDAPYGWLFVSQAPAIANSYVWKTGVIGGVFAEPNLQGVTDLPPLNTIYPA
jgi:peptide/nickel transport system substrate-binding protein